MNSRSHNSAYSRLMVLSDLGTGNVVKDSGGSRDLANGQIGLFRMKGEAANARGVQAVASLDGYGKNELFQIQVGTGRTQDAGNMTNKNFSTISFRRDDILDVTFDSAKAPVYSEVTLGYNGAAGTGIKLKENEATTVSLKLFGEQLSYLGFRDGVAEMTFNVFSGSPEACDNCLNPCANTSCKSITTDLVDTIREYELRAGSDAGTGASIKVGDLVEVIGTYSCAPELTPASTVTYYTLERCDEGNSEALAQVQAQYEGQTVTRIKREGTESTYQIVAATPPTGFNPIVTTVNDSNGDPRLVSSVVLLDCETCPTGYSRIEGGFIYKLIVDGNLTITAATLETNLVLDTAATSASVNDTGLRGDGPIDTKIVTITLDVNVAIEDMFDTIKDHAAGSALVLSDFELSFLQESSDVCVADADYDEVPVPWHPGSSCDIFNKTIEIDVDLDCGPFASTDAKNTAAAAKLAELQGIYPTLSVALASDDIGDCRARYTGTLTSAPVCEDCETPEPIFPAMPDDYEFSAWSERTAASGEVTSFTVDSSAASILENDTITATVGATGVTTSGSGTGATVVVTVTNGTVDDVKVTLSAAGSGFAIDDTITVSLVASDAGTPGAGKPGSTNTGTVVLTLTGVGGEFPDDCECGIKFVAKNAYLCPPAMLADQIGTFTPKGVKIQVSGGEAPSVLMEGYQFVTTPFRVTRHERDFDGTGWGINYMKQEKASAEYFAGISPRRSYAEGYLSGFETKLEPCVQYDKFTVKLKRNPYAGTASRRMGEEIRYIFLIPSGSGCSYESFVGALGGAVDCPEVENQQIIP